MYTPIKEESDSDHESSPSSEDYESLLSHSQARKASSRRNYFWLILALPIIAFSHVGLGVWIGSRWFANPNDVCPRHVQRYCKSSCSEKRRQG